MIVLTAQIFAHLRQFFASYYLESKNYLIKFLFFQLVSIHIIMALILHIHKV